MFNVAQFRELILKPALHNIVMSSPNAEELLIFTCAVESGGGTYLAQINGPALGIYQMEPKTYNDIWQNYIRLKTSLLMIMISNFHAGYMPDEFRLVYDLQFATVMTRIHYDRVKEKLPDCDDVDAIWEYYKRFYNTSKGAAEKDSAIQAYLKFRNN